MNERDSDDLLTVSVVAVSLNTDGAQSVAHLVALLGYVAIEFMINGCVPTPALLFGVPRSNSRRCHKVKF